MAGFSIPRMGLGALPLLVLLLAPPGAGAHKATPDPRTNPLGHGTVTMCVDPDWEPFEQITPHGEYVGIAADLVRLVAQRVGVELRLVPTRDWDESLALSRNGTCEILPFINQTPVRDQWLLFTEPYFIDPNVFITRVEHDYIANPAELSGKTIALPSGASIVERIRRDYPNLAVLVVESEAEALRMVEERKADMTLRSLTMAAYTIRKEGWFNLKISGEIPSYANRLRIGVTRDKPELRDILDAGTRTVTPPEVREIVNRHVAITVASRVDNALLYKIAGGAAALLVVGLSWILVLRRLNRKLVALRDQLQAELGMRRRAEAHLRLVLDTAPTYIFARDAQGRFILANKALADAVGLTPGDLLGGTVEMFGVSPELAASYLRDDQAVIESGRELVIPEEQIPRKDGTLGWFQVIKTPYRLPELDAPAVLGVAVDITERKAVEEQLRHMASTDVLTGVCNRRCFMDAAGRELARCLRYRAPLSVVMFDVDHFKRINDTYGHEAGDTVLAMLAAMARDALREVDVLGRLGGEEFAVLLPETDLSHAVRVAERLRAGAEAMEAPLARGERATISLGVAQADPVAVATIDVLLRHADLAMYRAKQAGRNRVAAHGGEAQPA